MERKKCGLIGKTLKHSYSKIIHGKFNVYDYDLYEIQPERLCEFVKQTDLNGYNVTIPYKKDIIQYLDFVDQSAKEIGAINTVVRKEGLLYGYNTDYLGMAYTVRRAGITVKDKTIMILGSGGTSNTAKAVFNGLGAKKIIIVSRTGEINYQNCYDIEKVDVIVNTTPVGTYPETNACPIDLLRFKGISGVVDVVYNPFVTKLIYQARSLGIKTTNGFPMLVAQAKYAMEKFTGQTVSDDIIEKTIQDLKKEMVNIVLVGMPGCGKTTIGKQIAKLLGREFIDTDLEIEIIAGKSIPTIFAQDGEDEFRRLEKQVCERVGNLYGKVIATGGGVVKNQSNKFELIKNGRIYYLKRNLEKLALSGRPLSKDQNAVKALYQERKSLYEDFACVTVNNDGDIKDAIQGVISDYENFSD